jgi:hypothetical protein
MANNKLEQVLEIKGSWPLPGGTGKKSRQTSDSTTSVPAYLQAGILSNTILDQYHYANLLVTLN